MPRAAVPTPVAAALGLVPAVLSGVRSLPGKAVQIPVLALSSTLTALDNARREYDDLAARGERLVARLRGQSFDEVEDKLEKLVDGKPFAGAYDTIEDAVEEALQELEERFANTGSDALQVGTGPVANGVALGAGKRGASGFAKAALPEQLPEVPEAEQPKGGPTPKAPQNTALQNTAPENTASRAGEQLGTPRLGAAATPQVVAVVASIIEEATADGASPVAFRDELPIDDYDHMTLGSLRGHLRSLELAQLVQLRDYEKAHAHRLPVVTMLDNRIAKLATTGEALAAAPAPATASMGASKGTTKKTPAGKPGQGKGTATKVPGKVPAKVPGKVSANEAAKNPAPAHTKVRLT